MFGNMLRKESPLPSIRDSVDALHPHSAQGKPPMDKRNTNINNPDPLNNTE